MMWKGPEGREGGCGREKLAGFMGLCVTRQQWKGGLLWHLDEVESDTRSSHGFPHMLEEIINMLPDCCLSSLPGHEWR